MNKSIKSLLLVIGIALLAYGFYMLIAPEASVSIGDFNVSAQDNSDAYITIALGIVAVAVSLLVGRR